MRVHISRAIGVNKKLLSCRLRFPVAAIQQGVAVEFRNLATRDEWEPRTARERCLFFTLAVGSGFL